MGEILLAEDTRLKRKVAIKVISTGCMRDAQSRNRFRLEAQAASRLDHPNICTIFEISEESGRDYIIMQYIDGITISQLLHTSRIAPDQAVGIAIQVSDGLIEAHRHHIIHRDIKPGNIMIDRLGKVKILDFGLAKIVDDPACTPDPRETHPSAITQSGVIIGTAPYMSPEQIKGERVDQRTDIFSYGIVFYEMLEGSNPFIGKDSFDTLYKIVSQPINFSRKTPKSLIPIIETMLKKKPEERYKSFSEVKADLLKVKILDQVPMQDPKTIPTTVITTAEEKWTEDFRRISDHSTDQLSQVVEKVKKIKSSTKVQQRWRMHWKSAAAIIICISVILMISVFSKRQKRKESETLPVSTTVQILLNDFSIAGDDKTLNNKFLFLLHEALGQFKGIEPVKRRALTLSTYSGQGKPQGDATLIKRLGIDYLLTGSIDKDFMISATLSRQGQTSTAAPIIVFAKDMNSLLVDQVDNLALRIVSGVRGQEMPLAPSEYKQTSLLYGSDWKVFGQFYEGMGQWENQAFDSAISTLNKAAKSSAPVLAANYFLAQAYEMTGFPLEADKAIQRLISNKDLLPQAMQLKVLALYHKQKYESAKQIQRLSELTSRYPLDKEIRFNLAEAFFHIGDAENAKAEYQKALDLDPRFTLALNHLGYCYSYLGEHAKAIQTLEAYCSINPTANAYDSLGDVNFYKGDYPQAENNKWTVLKKDPTIDWLYLTLADINILKAKFQEAFQILDTYEKKTKGKKQISECRSKRALVYLMNEEYQRALDEIDRAIQNYDNREITDNTAEFHWMRALVLLAIKRIPEAREETRWIQGVVSDYHLSSNNFHTAFKFHLHLQALLAEIDHRYNDAERFFQELVDLKPRLSYWITAYNFTYFLTEYAAYQNRQGHREQGEALLDQALAFNPNYTPALWEILNMRIRETQPNTKNLIERIRSIYGQADETNRWRKKLALLESQSQ